MSNTKQIIIQLLPFLLEMALIYFLWRQSLVLLIICFLILVAYILMGHHRTYELKMATLGILWGFALELTGVKSGFHVFNSPDFMGIPLWLPVFWGQGFVTAKRISYISHAKNTTGAETKSQLNFP